MVTGASGAADFDQVEFPSLVSGSFTRNKPAACQGCPNSLTTHRVWSDVSIGPALTSELWMTELIGIGNKLRENWRRQASYQTLMHRIAYGVERPERYPNGPNAISQEWDWELDSISGDEVTVKYQAGDDDPRAVSFNEQTLNPDWGQLDGGGNPEPKWETTAITAALSTYGVLTFEAPSRMRFHGGLVVKRIEVPSPFIVGSTFKFHVFLTSGLSLANAAAKWPASSGTAIRVKYRVYALYPENWPAIRDDLPMFVVPKTVDIENAQQQVYTLETGSRVRPPKAGTDWFQAWTTGPLAEIDLDDELQIVHSGSGSGYDTKLDLTARAELTGETIRLLYYIESGEDYAVSGGQDRCANSACDCSGSWGEADAEGRRWYCALRDSASLAANFKRECMQTGCSGWTPDAPTHPMAQDLMKMLEKGVPWRAIETDVATGDYQLIRWEAPGLGALAGMDLGLDETGWHQKIRMYYPFDVLLGRWARRSSVGGFVFGIGGDLFLAWKKVGQMPDLAKADTWPDFGPCGNLYSRLLEYGTEVASDANDPVRVERGRLMLGRINLVAYGGGVSGQNGEFQRLGSNTNYRAYFPNLAAGAGAQAFDDGTFTRADFEMLGVTYKWKITLSGGIRYDRSGSDAFGGLETSVTIKRASWDEQTGVLTCWLVNGSVRASRVGGEVGEEIETVWKQCGENVDLPDPFRVMNWACDQSRRGPRTGKVHAGHCAKFPGTLGDNIQARKFWITAARAGDSGQTDSWVPESDGPSFRYRAGGYVHIDYTGSASESLSSVTVTRDSGGTELQAASGAGGGRPYDLAKDVYFYEEKDDSELGRGLWVYFSHLQGTGLDADRIVRVQATTDEGSYDQTVNLETDAEFGWDTTTKHSIEADEDISSVAEVTVRRRGADGQSEEVTLTAYAGGSEPTNYEDWDEDKYIWTAGPGSAEGELQVGPMHAGESVRVQLVVDLSGWTDEAAYYAAKVAPLGARQLQIGGATGSLPAGHESWANRCDKIEILDENDAIATWLTVWDVEDLAGETLEIYSDGALIGATAAVQMNEQGSSDADEEIEAAKLMIWGAEGEIWGTEDVAAGKCLIVEGAFADRRGMPRDEEANAPREAAEAMIRS